MKAVIKLLVISVLLSIGIDSYSQLFYKNELPTEDGIEINYRFARAKFFDRNSPQTLRLKLKNTKDYDALVKFELVYTLNIVDRYESGPVEICIPANRRRKGKLHGLIFEVLVDDVADFDSDKNLWELEGFTVEQVEDCKLIEENKD